MSADEAGLGIVEVLISLVLGMLLAIALFTVLHGTLYGAISQRGMSALQEAERRAVNNIQQVAHSGGYFVVSPTLSTVGPTPLSTLQANTALVASTYASPYGTFAPGQYIDGVSSSNSSGMGDVLNIRFQSAENANTNEPTTMNCLGQTNNNSTTPIYYNNSYFVDPNTQSLDCAVNGGTPQILVGNGSNGGIQVQSMSVLYGVDTNGSDSVTAYETASQVSNWSNVLTAQITLNFNNPLYVATENNGQPQTIPFTFLVDFMGAGGVN
ncbi:PilW family protein [Acidithiobacillus sp. HP-11]|uniref:PilW family protein n=1 Tax=Acidithiobacillus sp. HP-11 TaxID=2697656 RepID=UPI00187A1A58|nr:PilW family protein [Acidithiobacillus sp. HP-11]MBE7565942.1 PilW family protein [Acidithiobacillus sp. HP-11]